jgi:hypothetical protein
MIPLVSCGSDFSITNLLKCKLKGHKSILTTEEHVETLRDTTAKVYSKYLGIVAELKETIYNDHNAMLEIREYITRKADEKKFKKKITEPHPLQKFLKQ